MGKQVLIADDDPVVRHLLSSVLSAAGFEVLLAETGAACLNKVEECERANTPVSLLFLDLQLSDMSGADVLLRIRERASVDRLPVVILSANSEEEVRLNFPSMDADMYLEKPFPPEKIVQIARKLSERA